MTFPSPLVPGTYFGLPDADYHRDAALGSTDIRRLRRSGPDYWFHSILNPHRPNVAPTPAMAFGRAIHTLVLEGAEKFCRLYECEPDREGLLVSDADLAEWLTAHGCNKLPRLKSEKIETALRIDPGVRVLDLVRQRAAAAGRQIIAADDWERMTVAGGLITRDPSLATAFQNGAPEVSVVWDRDDGVRCKARFDYLKPRGIADLKSIRNSRGMDFPAACIASFGQYRYDIQAAHYLEGRRQLARLYESGAPVFGEHDPAWLKRVAESPEYAMVFVFFQAEDAPITYSFTLSPENPILDYSRLHIEDAIDRFKQFRETFKPGEMWVLSEPVREIDLNDLPPWFGR